MTLLEILKSIPSDFNEPIGICNYVYRHGRFNPRYDVHLKSMFPHWPEYSGSQTYPVPSPLFTPPLAFTLALNDNTMWSKDDPYGQARWRLLEFCIRRLEIQTAMLNVLKSIPDDYVGPWGICNLLWARCGYCWTDIKPIAQEIFKSWPEFSGNPEYPVPDEHFMDPCTAYNLYSPAQRWSHTHPYGQARWRLIGHMIEALTDATA